MTKAEIEAAITRAAAAALQSLTDGGVVFDEAPPDAVLEALADAIGFIIRPEVTASDASLDD